MAGGRRNRSSKKHKQKSRRDDERKPCVYARIYPLPGDTGEGTIAWSQKDALHGDDVKEIRLDCLAPFRNFRYLGDSDMAEILTKALFGDHENPKNLLLNYPKKVDKEDDEILDECWKLRNERIKCLWRAVGCCDEFSDGKRPVLQPGCIINMARRYPPSKFRRCNDSCDWQSVIVSFCHQPKCYTDRLWECCKASKEDVTKFQLKADAAIFFGEEATKALLGKKRSRQAIVQLLRTTGDKEALLRLRQDVDKLNDGDDSQAIARQLSVSDEMNEVTNVSNIRDEIVKNKNDKSELRKVLRRIIRANCGPSSSLRLNVVLWSILFASEQERTNPTLLCCNPGYNPCVDPSCYDPCEPCWRPDCFNPCDPRACPRDYCFPNPCNTACGGSGVTNNLARRLIKEAENLPAPAAAAA